MRSFFKIFFASFLALTIFCLIAFFILVGIAANLTTKSKAEVTSGSVLVLDLAQAFHEMKQESVLSVVSGETDIPSLYDVVRLIKKAKTDNHIAGILLVANENANGFASSEELRNALQDFKKSGKFIIAHGDMMSQKAYFVATAADRIYLNPTGNLDWKGFDVTFLFLRGMLDKLEIHPQVFYAGKFKSATEVFRTFQMTPENRLQTTIWLNALYNYFLQKTASARHLDTGSLHQLANTATIQKPSDAVGNKLVDGLRYDDEVKAELKKRIGIGKYDLLKLVPLGKYYEAVSIRKSGRDRIAIIYAEGDIVDGNGSRDNIGGDRFRGIIRKARLDKSVKAIVLRVNSGGGSALASEIIWRELEMARQDGKPVVISFGDVAASGGYYISCGADSIFSSPNTITGSIGVFGIIPDMGNFFKNKLGITFDGVKTAPYADAGAIYRAMNEEEKILAQNSVERIYAQFKERVSKGRKKDIGYIDSIAQGRVWIGEDALKLGLTDRIGGLTDALDCAARMAHTTDFGIREYPEQESWLETFLGRKKTDPEAMMKEQLGEENYKVYSELVKVRQLTNSVQARLPFQFYIK